MLENRNSLPKIDENTFYRMKMMVDDNGHVKVKTAQKEPGKEWDIQTKEYDRKGNMKDAIEHENSKQKVEALEGKKKGDEKVDMKKAENETTNMKASEDVANTKLEKIQKENKVSKREKSDFDEIESIFDSINRDFETNFRKTFGFFDSFYRPEESPMKSESSKVIEHSKPEKKAKATKEGKSENDTQLNTTKTGTESKKEDQVLAKRDIAGFDEIQTVFDNINREFEDNIMRSFGRFDPFSFRAWPEPFRYRIELDPEHTFYNMRSMVNDNGHVKVKTARKEPGKEWDVKEEEYDGKGKAVEGKKENAAIQEEKSNTAQITDYDEVYGKER
jgi:hypothetical protein